MRYPRLENVINLKTSSTPVTGRNTLSSLEVQKETEAGMNYNPIKEQTMINTVNNRPPTYCTPINSQCKEPG